VRTGSWTCGTLPSPPRGTGLKVTRSRNTIWKHYSACGGGMSSQEAKRHRRRAGTLSVSPPCCLPSVCRRGPRRTAARCGPACRGTAPRRPTWSRSAHWTSMARGRGRGRSWARVGVMAATSQQEHPAGGNGAQPSTTFHCSRQYSLLPLLESSRAFPRVKWEHPCAHPQSRKGSVQ